MNVEWGLHTSAGARAGVDSYPPLDDPFDTLRAPAGSPAGQPLTTFTGTFQNMIDGLPEQIALLDEEWKILLVNEAWTKTAAIYGFQALGPGANYFRFCEDRALEGHQSASAVAGGISEIMSGCRDSFRMNYSGSDRWAGHEFQLCINRLQVDGRQLATVTRYDITELVQLRKLREIFSQSVIQGQNDERRRMAREIHDSTTQLLASIGLALGQLRRANETERSSDIVAEIEELLAETQREIRSISYLAHPPALQELGLSKAIETLVAGYCRRTGLDLSYRTETLVPPVWKTAEIALYRVVQESLSNVHRHAHATEAAVGLFLRHSMIHAVVVDNGSGLSIPVDPGVGLLGMRERIEELGGRLAIRARHPGTAVIASLPIQPVVRAVGDLAMRA